ncbi:hypothetical protein BGZ49_001858, partial [Haplosporangium sp. Z 27]
DIVLVYHFSTLTPSGTPVVTKRLSDPRCANDEFIDKTINVIQVGYLGTEEVLVTADEAGDVCVWFTKDLQREPLLLSVTESAWGIAIHSEKRLIAVSCNARTITIFHCGIDSRISQSLLFGDMESSTSDLTTPSQNSTTTSEAGPIPSPLPMERASQQILLGHEHNIPHISFSPCGEFLASASVDRTCRTWRLSDEVQIQQKSLGNLWGWGVSFVDNDSWITLTRAEYKQIPKVHLRPGKLPGQNVRDSPLSTTAFSQRRLPQARDIRMIRSRWFAGPLHNTSCDELDSDEDDERRRAMDGGDGLEDNDDMDDRDAALFGMDDDEGEDEWEDMSSSEADYMDDDEADVARQRSSNVTPVQDVTDTSADTGDDGDNEGAGGDTDGGGFTTEDGTVRPPITARSIKPDTTRRSTMPPLLRVLVNHESSSEHEQLTSRSHEVDSVTMSEAENVVSNTKRSTQERKDEELVEDKEDEADVNLDPGLFIKLTSAEQYIDRHHQTSIKGEAAPTRSTSTSHASTKPHQLPPQYPSELLLCATARNIYLLGRHPASPLPSETRETKGDRDSSSSSSENTLWTGNYSNLSSAVIRADDDNEDNDHDDDMPSITEMAAHAGYINWHEEQESEYDPEYDTDPYYEDMDDFMGTADEEHGSSDEDDDENDGDDDNDSQYEDVDEEMEDPYSHVADNDHNPSVSQLHTLSVARAAATRADGRRNHILDHFDRIFVMLLVPELSVLVAASQKGTVAVIRLLRVLDDPPLPNSVSKTKSTSLAKDQGRANEEKNKESNTDQSSLPSSSSSAPPTITVQGSQYILFPEIYLPRLEPSAHPLLGVSIVPLQRSNTSYLQHPNAFDSSSEEPDSLRNGDSDNHSNSKNQSRSGKSIPGPNLPSSAASFMLHLIYMDAQLYSYEIRLRNEKDDPVGLSNVFV